jgi:hypothetical protein
VPETLLTMNSTTPLSWTCDRLRRRVRNDPGKSNLAVLFLFWTFPGDENVASSPASPEPRLVFGYQENRPASFPCLGASATFILVSAESASSDDFN